MFFFILKRPRAGRRFSRARLTAWKRGQTMKDYETEIEKGLSFARALLAKRLDYTNGDPSGTADLALATLALVAARDAQKKSVSILKFPPAIASERRRDHAVVDESAPATIDFEKAISDLPSRDVRAVKSPRRSYVETRVPYLRLYQED